MCVWHSFEQIKHKMYETRLFSGMHGRLYICRNYVILHSLLYYPSTEGENFPRIAGKILRETVKNSLPRCTQQSDNVFKNWLETRVVGDRIYNGQMGGAGCGVGGGVEAKVLRGVEWYPGLCLFNIHDATCIKLYQGVCMIWVQPDFLNTMRIRIRQ